MGNGRVAPLKSAALPALISGLPASHPDWNRTRLSVELCARWEWRLERSGHIRLPARRGPSPNARRNRHLAPVAGPSEPIRAALRDPHGSGDLSSYQVSMISIHPHFPTLTVSGKPERAVSAGEIVDFQVCSNEQP